jgi:hypothetical protein
MDCSGISLVRCISNFIVDSEEENNIGKTRLYKEVVASGNNW